MDELIKEARRIAAEKAVEIRNKSLRSEVGGGEILYFFFDGQKYELEVDVWFDKLDHFDYRLTGIGILFSHFEKCVTF